MEQNSEGGSKMSSDELKLRLQIETSLLVWTRTSLALMGFGFVVARFGLFLREIGEVGQARVKTSGLLASLNTFTGTTFILLGVAVLLAAVGIHRRLVDRLERGDLRLPLRWSLGVILSLVLAVLGFGMAVYLSAVEF
jgi:putative membrane protein